MTGRHIERCAFRTCRRPVAGNTWCRTWERQAVRIRLDATSTRFTQHLHVAYCDQHHMEIRP